MTPIPTRRKVALPRPPSDLGGFPRWSLTKRNQLYRAHRAGKSPWWFASDAEGRFNLADPWGTCYLAFDAETVLRERFGTRLVRQGWVSTDLAQQAQVSKLTVLKGGRVADVTASSAVTFGVTPEINTTGNYPRTQLWAAALRAAGFLGIRYEARFSTRASAQSLALFGDVGEAAWPTDRHPTGGIDATRAAGIAVVSPPLPSALTYAMPPGP